DGTTKATYEKRELIFSDISVRHNGGVYTGEGSLSWDQAGKTGYRFNTRAQDGYPNDIIRLFYESLPLDTRANGSVAISGVNQEFRVEGNMEVKGGSIYDVAFDHGNVSFDINSARIRFPKISLERGLSSMAGEGEINFQGGYEASVTTRNLHLEDISLVYKLPALQGSFSGEIAGKGTFSHPHLILTGNFSNLFYRDQTIEEGETRIILDGETAEIHAGFKGESVRLDGSVSIVPPYISNFTLSGNNIPLSPLLAVSSSWQYTSIQGSVTGTIDVDGPLSRVSDLALKATISRLSANLNGYEIANKDDISFRIRDRELTIESFRLAGEGTLLNLSGGLIFFKKYGLFISGEADLSLLKSFQKIVTQGVGKAYLAVKISDLWDNPKIQGGLTVQEGQIRVSFLRETVQISNLGLFFNEHQVLLENLDGSLGEGSFHGTGKLDLEGFKPGAFGFMLETPGIRIAPVSGWASMVAGTLFLQGNSSDQDLQGEIVLSRGEYKTPFDLKALVNALARTRNRIEPIPYFGPMRLNIRITGDDKLDINNNIARIPF
ncbi:MAG TPA: hypothetical protein VN944_10355, partial [Nitrospiria bacterium]|nr:hypothetical protein [Nitrospiria bacterium]